MDGIHDLGGVEGFGPIPLKDGDAHFREIEEWEKRMWGLARCGIAQGITIDWFRHGIERMAPADYLSFAYFNKWCANYFVMLLDSGAITMDDISRGHLENPAAPAQPITVADALAINLEADTNFEIEVEADPAFTVGQTVCTCAQMHSGHTRLPRYARGARGVITAYHGSHALPDKGAEGKHLGEHLYTVCFSASELWGDEANPNDTVAMELWESYLVST